jgi:hypothetical protein
VKDKKPEENKKVSKSGITARKYLEALHPLAVSPNKASPNIMLPQA